MLIQLVFLLHLSQLPFCNPFSFHILYIVSFLSLKQQYTVFGYKSHYKKKFFFYFFTCIFVWLAGCGFGTFFTYPIRWHFGHQMLFCVKILQKKHQKTIRIFAKTQNIDTNLSIRVYILIFILFLTRYRLFTNHKPTECRHKSA